MEILENVLRKINELKKDLEAEIEVQKLIWHYETEVDEKPYQRGSYTWDKEFSETTTREVIDQPRVVKPNIEKRQEAKSKLEEIYNSSVWYSARHEAANALNLKHEDEIPNWINDLKKNLKAEKIESYFEECDTGHLTTDPRGGGCSFDKEIIAVTTGTKTIEATRYVTDWETRDRAEADLIYLYKNIKEKKHRLKIGKILGYNFIKINIDEIKRKNIS